MTPTFYFRRLIVYPQPFSVKHCSSYQIRTRVLRLREKIDAFALFLPSLAREEYIYAEEDIFFHIPVLSKAL